MSSRFVLLPVTMSIALMLGACGGGSGDGGAPMSVAGKQVVVSEALDTAQTGASSSLSGSGVDRSGAWPAAALADMTDSTAPNYSIINSTAYNGQAGEPQYPTQICATIPATLTKNAKDLLDDSVDSDPTNSKSQPDASRIQVAINACTQGGAVKLVAGANGQNAFLTGPITLKSKVVLWIDSGVTLFASRSPVDYQISGKNTCGDMSSSDNGCNALITGTDVQDSGVMGEGVIDGRGGAVLTSGPNAGKQTWWDLGAQTKTRTDGNTSQNNPRLVQVSNKTATKPTSARFTLYKITLQNAPKFHFVPSGVKGVKVWGVKVLTPSLAYSALDYNCPAGTTPTMTGTPNTTTPSSCYVPDTTKNTDAIDPGQSQDVLIAFNHVSTGDDGVAIKSHDGTNCVSGTSGIPTETVTNVNIIHNRLYFTHGMSVGSETDCNINGVVIKDMTIDGNDANFAVGVRVKTDRSRGGEVKNVSYDGICVRRAQEALTMDDYYDTSKTGSAYPNIHDVTVKNYHYVNYPGSIYNDAGAWITFRGFSDASVSKTYPLTNIVLDNVVFDGTPTLKSAAASGNVPAIPSNASIAMNGPVSFASLLMNAINAANNFAVSGTGTGAAAPYDCSNAFVPYPSNASPI